MTDLRVHLYPESVPQKLFNVQLGQLQNISTSVDILTTNKSQLKEGFFLFTGFVLLGLLISTRVEKP